MKEFQENSNPYMDEQTIEDTYGQSYFFNKRKTTRPKLQNGTPGLIRNRANNKKKQYSKKTDQL